MIWVQVAPVDVILIVKGIIFWAVRANLLVRSLKATIHYYLILKCTMELVCRQQEAVELLATSNATFHTSRQVQRPRSIKTTARSSNSLNKTPSHPQSHQTKSYWSMRENVKLRQKSLHKRKLLPTLQIMILR